MNARTLLLLLPLLALAIFLLTGGKKNGNGEGAPGAGASSASQRNGSGSHETKPDRHPTKSGPRKERAKLKTTDSGLQYQVLQKGTGDTPGPGDSVAVHYEGRLEDGTVFDSSDGRQEMKFSLPQVIAGWQEGLQLMQTGGKYRFIIPPELAYGERGAGGKIPPNATLVFEIELVSVTPTGIIDNGGVVNPVFSTRELQREE